MLLEGTRTSLVCRRGRGAIPIDESAEFELPAQEDVRCDLRSVFLGAIPLKLEALLEEEIRTMGAEPLATSERAQGRPQRQLPARLITSMGAVDVAVPRARESGSAGEVRGRYRRRSEEIDEAVAAAYVHGVRRGRWAR